MTSASFTADQLTHLAGYLNPVSQNWTGVQTLVPLGMKEQFRCFRNKEPYKIYLLLYKISLKANESFRLLEQKAVKIFPSDLSEDLAEQFEAYKKRFIPYLSFANSVEGCLRGQNHRGNSDLLATSSVWKQELLSLESNFIALRYRLGLANGGIDPSFNQHLYESLQKQALAWKSDQKLSPEKGLNDLENRQLWEAAHYIEWWPLMANEEYRNDFFNWALRDYNPVDVFIMFRNTQKKIKYALLSGILGRIRKPGEQGPLRIEEVWTEKAGKIGKRILTLPFYQGDHLRFNPDDAKRINILKPSDLVTFASNFTLSIDQLWKELAVKLVKDSKINYSAEHGLINYHPAEGVWDGQNQRFIKHVLDRESWWRMIPAADTIPDAVVQKKYSDRLQGRAMFFKVVATRQHKDLTAFRCHGFWQIYIKSEENQYWKVLDIGAYPAIFPVTAMEQIRYFCNTVEGVCVLMDQNGSYSHRQSAAIPFFPDEHQMEALLKNIYDHFYGNPPIPFQFCGENCSCPVQTKVQEVFPETPNLFLISMSRVKTGFQLLDKLLEFLEKCSLPIRLWGIKIILNLFGALRKFVVNRAGVSTTYSVNKFYEKQQAEQQARYESPVLQMYHPASLHGRVEQAQQKIQSFDDKFFVNGEITWGNTMMKLDY